MSLTKEDLQSIREVVREEITPLSEEVTPLIERVTSLSDHVTSLSDHVTSLSDHVTSLSDRVTGLSEQFTQFREENRNEHWEIRKLINIGIGNYSKLDSRVTRIEKHLSIT